MRSVISSKPGKSEAPARVDARLAAHPGRRSLGRPLARLGFVTTALLIILAINGRAVAQNPPRQAQLSWWDRSPEKKVGYYWIKTDLPAAQANALARHLNLMYEEYSRRLASLPLRGQEKLNVLIFKDPKDYLLTLRARFGVNAEGTGGMFFVTQAGAALAFWVEGLPQRRIEHVVQHEGFHQFAYSRFGDDLPMWLNEGMAEFFGESVMVDDKLIIGQNTPRTLDAIKNAVETNTSVPFRSMLSMSPQKWNAAVNAGDAAMNYHQAWSMVHFLVYGDGGKYTSAFETYLRHLNNGLPSEEAFVRTFGPDIEQFEAAWKKYALAAKPSAFVTALERMEFLAEGLLELGRLKKYPQSMDELKAMLREINFSHVTKAHGREEKLSAADDTLFTIPLDDLCPEQPVFELSRPKSRATSKKERMLEEANPTPPVIATKNLRPKGLGLKWLRDDDANTFNYDVVVQK